MKLEFMIYPADADWFRFRYEEYPRVLRPRAIPSHKIKGWGSNRIQVQGEEIAFSDELNGFQVIFESGRLSEVQALEIMEDICSNIEAETGQKARFVQVSG